MPAVWFHEHKFAVAETPSVSLKALVVHEIEKYLRTGMTEEVVVTRKGQTTIRAELRRKYSILVGSRFRVEDTADGILLKKVPRTIDMLGSGARRADVQEMKRLLDELRGRD